MTVIAKGHVEMLNQRIKALEDDIQATKENLKLSVDIITINLNEYNTDNGSQLHLDNIEHQLEKIRSILS